MRSLGYVNHDMTFLKTFDMGAGRRLQLRIEAYNAFNQTQWGAVTTNAQFNFATGAQRNTNFGKVTGGRGSAERVLQLGLRFTF